MTRPTKDQPIRICNRCGKQGRFTRETECGTCAAKRKDWLSDKAKARQAKYLSKPGKREQKNAYALARYYEIKADPEKYAHLNNIRRKLERKYQGHANPTSETRSGACEICCAQVECLRLDHDHDTGAARGWLCNKCNLGLGSFNDEPKRLAAALNYLQMKGAPYLRLVG